MSSPVRETSSTSNNNNCNNDAVLIGIDVGTQSTKSLLYDPINQKVIARSSRSYDLDDNPNKIEGRAEQHPRKWLIALKETLQDLSVTIRERKLVVGGMGVSGQQHGMVLLDENDHVIRSAKLWCDVEAVDQAKQFSKLAGWNVSPGFTAPKVLWSKDMEPEIFENTKYILLPHDYINYALRKGITDATCTPSSGENTHTNYDNDSNHTHHITPTTDAGDASGTGIFDPATRQYIPHLADLLNANPDHNLPKILPPNASCGNLSSQWKSIIQIDSQHTYEVPLSVGSGDNMCSALGTGCVSPGTAVLSLGTSGTIFGVSDVPVARHSNTVVAPFCDATGKHLPLVCIMSCTSVLNSILEHWCSDNSSNLTHAKATELASKIPPGCHGLTFLPYLGGERTPNWPHATGAMLNVTSQNIHTLSDPGMKYRMAMEGVTYLLADALEHMRQACNNGSDHYNDNNNHDDDDDCDNTLTQTQGFNPNCLLVVGGGSKNKLWRQMLSDVLGMELRFPLENESAALGAAFQAGAIWKGQSVEDFVKDQHIEMDANSIVKPTEDEATLKAYRDGLERYRFWSKKLFL